MKIPVPNGGSSGSGSTECTATAEDVLETKTAIYDGSGDEPEYGSMKNVDSIDPAKSITISSGVLYARMTNGAHVQDASSGYPEVSVPQADLASTAGLTADKIATGNSILGISGSYNGKGTAGTSQVLSGYTFSSDNLNGASGAMSDRAGTTTSATPSLDSGNSRVRMKVPNTGYYDTNAYLYSTYANMASTINLTADKIVAGNTILGIAGTNYGKGVPAENALYYEGENFYSMQSGSYFGYTQDGAVFQNFCDFILNLGINTAGTLAVCAFTSQTFDLSKFSTFHIRLRQFHGVTESSLRLRFIYGPSLSERENNIYRDINPDYALQEYTINLSSYTGTYYIGVGFLNNSDSGNMYLVDYIWLT